MASVFVYPSFYEGFGLPPLEAMACGVPTFVSATSSLPEVVGSAGVLLSPLDSSAWADAMLSYASNPAALADLGRRGRERASQFTWQKAAQAYLNLFRKICT